MAEKGWIEIGHVVGDTDLKEILEQLDNKENKDLRDILDRPAQRGTLELLVLVLLLKVRITLTKN
ncbi:hypothetical protein [Methanobrevibacter smithii]|uniref:hypothetical protein n=1 Tax=Methanobrevibacter smithii TaxID=2173 RepID=UPI0037DC4EF8